MMSVVWFKRDLRIKDHQPLNMAAQAGTVIPLYIHEPSMVAAPDWSAQHSGFLKECLESLNTLLSKRGAPLVEMAGEAVEGLSRLRQRAPFEVLWSHQETGNALSYERDKAVKAWCSKHGVRWMECAQNGVIRGSHQARQQRGWAAELEDYTSSEPLADPGMMASVEGVREWFASDQAPTPAGDDKPSRMKGGRERGFGELKAFFKQTITRYPKSVSSPLTAEKGCSRLGPYLSFGVLSVREVVYAMNLRLQSRDMAENPAARDYMISSMRFYADRLKWRSSYLQNMENMPELEHENLDAGMDGLRESEFDPLLFEAWRTGVTGYPMVDASMRMLKETGWINMRMRGMLMSFAANELWLHWREPGLHLAREFLDYEPGIHYNQLQIHSCTAGGAHFLSYNPVKQARDLDPSGVFVRRWLPALQGVPDPYIFEPWLMPLRVQEECGVIMGQDYPSPVVDHVSAGKKARDKIAARRKSLQA
jgi:deoxyribodipyrimidine photo-lyase